MTISPATNVVDAYKQCNPDYALPANDNRYIDLSEVRGENIKIISTIRRSIERSDDNTCTYLISGHRGSGKTTELFRLKQRLEQDQYLCVYFDVGDALDLADISYIDIFLAMVDATSKSLQESNINIDNDAIKEIHNWVTQEAYAESTVEKQIDGKASAGIEVNVGIPSILKLFGNLTGDIKHSQSQRHIIRENIEKKASDFIRKINQFLISVRIAIQKNNYKDIVIIVDGLEKMHYRTFSLMNNQSDSHTQLFVQHAEQLLSLQSHVVYTTPISLFFISNLQNDYENVYILPMVRLNNAGKSTLKDLVQKRVDIEAVFSDPTLVDMLIESSGGVVRDLMRLIRLSCDTDETQVSAKEVKYAVSRLTREYDRLLKPSDIPILERVYRTELVNPDDERTNQLLLNRVILEYENGKRSAKLHPACLEIGWVMDEINNLTAANT
ncbi:hypothetical protein [Psychrobacter glacincola]|uniref:Orc1-like AAA ATPase domain-containing protein n=1 Tax=Psychrobacter glacincola TaxID=56810 RepID=A0ABW1W8R4_9GAMM|nr:hypothetical protein [Psychrobacter glacincola]